jgi:hypothetical protein
VGLLGGAVDLLGLRLAIGLEHLRHVQHREQIALVALQSDPIGGDSPLDSEGDRKRPRQSAGEVHVLDRSGVVRLGHEPGQRRQRARRDHVEVGGLLLGHAHAGKAGRLLRQRGRIVAGHRPVNQAAAVGCNQLSAARVER